MANYHILKIDSLLESLTLCNSSTGFRFQFPIANDIVVNQNDLILGFVTPLDEVRYIFEVESTAQDAINLIKKCEVSLGYKVDLRSIEELQPVAYLKDFMTISEETFQMIMSNLLGLSLGSGSSVRKTKQIINLLPPAQTIFYGCPGTGKSHEVKKIAEGEKCEKVIWYKKEANAEGIYERVENPSDEEKKNLTNNVFRTTFHPDYDYATFVGCYKPVKDDDNKLDYRFIPQVFTNAYITALRHPEDPIYLIIEEINRGNCAQIFGDLFQLLDRRNGVSEYSIRPDTELSKYLASQNVPSEQLSLPANLNIYATMNTSDQSLFPMDSAFKRRWAMEYMPIKYDSDKASKFTIAIGDETYPWTGFLRMVNERILDATDSEDKQMGEYFIKDSVNEKEFINKVMFYIWNDVCKDHYTARRPTAKFFMRLQNHIEGEKEYFTFAELFDKEKNKNSHLLKEFIAYLEAKFIEDHKNAALDPMTNHIDWAKYMAPVATEAETE